MREGQTKPELVAIPEGSSVSELVAMAERSIFPGLSRNSVAPVSLYASAKAKEPLPLNANLLDPSLGSDTNPLILKVSTKSIQVAHQDQFGDCDNKFRSKTIASDLDVKNLLSSSNRSLFELGSNDLVNSYSELKEGEKYVVANPDISFGNWVKLEADAMEAEVTKTAKSYLESLGATTILELPRKLTCKRTGLTLQEWDGVLFAENSKTLFLIEAKHTARPDAISDTSKRVLNFRDLLDKSKTKAEYPVFLHDPVGIFFATHFPPELISSAFALRLLAGCPSGKGYEILKGSQSS
jgi:hypothetical protein